MELWTGFTLGLLGSFHCIGMCGPIALAIPGHNSSAGASFLRGTLYNSGRIITYALIGSVFGILGMGATITGYQHILSITLGVLIIIFALFPHIRLPGKMNEIYSGFTQKLTGYISGLYKNKSSFSAFFIGLLNGFLPCGFVVTALAAALITPSVFHSAAYMALFGLGTLPVMLMMNMAPRFITPRLRSKLRPFSTYFAIIIGLILIWRGYSMMTGGHMMHG
ncbi:MAG: sulfite exporter TauE/SafE family protein [Balneolaceae bacterium]|nr:sulfite exporter TauE/SafE family protein [Balneolaceae bacterium]